MINQASTLKKEQLLINPDRSDELQKYLLNNFRSKKTLSLFEGETGIKYWEDFAGQSTKDKLVFDELKKCYPQLNFPVEPEIDKKEEYKDLVLRGKTQNTKLPFLLKLNDYKNITLRIGESIAGKIPIITVPDKDDFIAILQCLLYKNNPKHIPNSMGAVLINGLNNWQKIAVLKNDWSAANIAGNWAEEFYRNVLPNYSLYQDKLIVISTKPYSNVSARQLGLNESLWLSYSISIRIQHEFAHLYTLKKFGTASNNLHDELIADYIGIVKTIGQYNKSWMLIFMGLENYPDYRQGARLENYISDNKLSKEDFNQLIKIIKMAIENISIFHESQGNLQSDIDLMCRIDALCETSLEELSAANGASLLIDNYNKGWKSKQYDMY
ncbi:DUF7005 family protein [Flavobacterium hungaricum]|uniref:Uncharacterized protein n=1 Tax=Flavobacterium hungaricum TaxID=2082725 RepID=A0ABR9TM52_9FLAO|nr:hypothetical protein [Flavobacterium hungaricum]MBE8726453.1 hypothetical protein [Flavobacterium hungaricum]